jgi:hypothetical protein
MANIVLFNSTVRLVVSLPPARSPVVSTRATATTTPRPVAATPGSSRTPRATGDTVKRSWVDRWSSVLRKKYLSEDVFISIKPRFYDYILEMGASIMQQIFQIGC